MFHIGDSVTIKGEEGIINIIIDTRMSDYNGYNKPQTEYLLYSSSLKREVWIYSVNRIELLKSAKEKKRDATQELVYSYIETRCVIQLMIDSELYERAREALLAHEKWLLREPIDLQSFVQNNWKWWYKLIKDKMLLEFER